MRRQGTLALVAVLILGSGARAEEGAATAPATKIGTKLPDFTIQDVEGRPFQLYASAIERPAVQKRVLEAAATFGAPADAGAKTALASLKGLLDEDGEIDGGLRRDFVCAAGSYFGMIATEDSAERFQSLGDVIDWVVAAKDAPIVFVAWSPNCPSVKRQNDRVLDLVTRTDARIFALACNARDTDEHYAKYKDAFEWNVRILPDRDQRVTDILGGKVTPHFFVVDKDAVLRYQGAIDNDPMGYMEEGEREDWIVDAIQAVRQGKAVVKTDSEPAG